MPATTAMPIELVLLAWSVILFVVHVMVQGQLSTRERGLAWNAGPRDGEPKPLSPVASRAERALANFSQTWPAFVVAALAVVVAGRTGGWSQAGAWLWFVARIAYLPLYLLGVPYLRSVVWGLALLGILMMLFQLV